MDEGGQICRMLFASTNRQAGNDTPALILDLVIILIFILINGFFSGTEMAVINLNDQKIKKEAEDGSGSAKKLLKFIENKGAFLATIQMGVTLAGFMSSAFAGDKLTKRLYEAMDPTHTMPYLQTVSLICITVILVFISLIFGELIPKQIAISNPSRFSKYAVGWIRFFDVVFRPFTKLLNWITKLFLNIFGIDPSVNQNAVTEEEIRIMLTEGRMSGNLHINETRMIENIFEFNDKEVSEIMTHRTNVIALDVESTYEAVVDIAINEKYSRIPVFEETIDDIVGVFHVKDLLPYLIHQKEEAFCLRNMLRPPYLIPETKHVDELFREMQSANVALAVVIDEYGGTSGIVTIEDVLEEIVGNIQDEYDDEQSEVTKVADNVYMVEGLTPIDDLKQYIVEFELDEDHTDFDTVAGLVLDILGRIPDEYEHPIATYKNYTFQVMAMDDNRIAKLKMTIYPKEEKQKKQIKTDISEE